MKSKVEEGLWSMSTEAISLYDVLSQLQPTFLWQGFPIAFQSLKNVIMSELLVPSVTVFNQYCDISIYLSRRQYILLYKLFSISFNFLPSPMPQCHNSHYGSLHWYQLKESNTTHATNGTYATHAILHLIQFTQLYRHNS